MVTFDPTFTTCGAAKILAELANTALRKRCSIMRSYFTYQKTKKPITSSDNERKPTRATRTIGSRARNPLIPRLFPRWLPLRAVGIFTLRAMVIAAHQSKAMLPKQFFVRNRPWNQFEESADYCLILNHKGDGAFIWMRVKG